MKRRGNQTTIQNSFVQKLMMIVLVAATFSPELLQKDLEVNHFSDKDDEVINTDTFDDTSTEFIVFDAFIGFSNERRDSDLGPYSTPSFSVLNPRLYHIHGHKHLEWRSFFVKE